MLSTPWLIALSAFVWVCHYVHTCCVEALGPNANDNSVQLRTPNDEPTSPQAKLVQPLEQPLLVVVLGWGGATSRQLRRIIDFCTASLGCRVVSYINPMIQYLYGDLHQPSISQLLAQVNDQMADKNGPSGFCIFVHSNNGALTYAEIKSQLLDPEGPYHHLLPRLRGVIFDSAPRVLDPAPGTADQPNVFVATGRLLWAALGFSFPSVAIVLKRAVYVHPFWTPAITLWAIIFRSVHAIRQRLSANSKSKGDDKDDAAYLKRRHLLGDIPRVQHLFLYSSRDRLIESKFVESYIAFVRSAHPTIAITSHDFVSTGHVQHFLKEPAVYATHLRKFLAEL